MFKANFPQGLNVIDKRSPMYHIMYQVSTTNTFFVSSETAHNLSKQQKQTSSCFLLNKVRRKKTTGMDV